MQVTGYINGLILANGLNMDQQLSPFELEKELCIFTLAMFATVTVISILKYSKGLLWQFLQGDIDARWCCQHLNDGVSIKTFLQLFLTIMFYAYGYHNLFVLNSTMMIWLSIKFFIGYDRNKITNRRKFNAYIRALTFDLAFYWACLTIYAYYEIKYASANIAIFVDRVYGGEKPPSSME